MTVNRTLITQMQTYAVIAVVIVAIGAGVVYYAMLPPPTPPAQTNIIWYTHWGYPIIKEAWDGFKGNWTLEYPDITVESYIVSSGDLHTKFMTLHAAGEDPDTFHIGVSNLPLYVEAGILDEPPAEVIADLTANYSQTARDFITWDGKMWGYPTENGIYSIIYYKEMLADAGIAEPGLDGWTLAEYRNVANQLVQYDDQGNIVVSGSNFDIRSTYSVFQNWLRSYQELSVDYANKEVLWNTDAGIYVLQNMWEMVHVDESTTIIDRNDASTQMADKLCATMPGGGWYRHLIYPAMGEANFEGNISLTSLKGDLRSQVQYSGFIAGVSAASENKEEAWLWTKWTNQPHDFIDGATCYGWTLGEVWSIVAARTSDQQYAQDKMPAKGKFFMVKVSELLSAYGIPTDLIFQESAEVNAILKAAVEATLADTVSFKRSYIDQAVIDANAILTG